jgi:hypothetical protein
MTLVFGLDEFTDPQWQTWWGMMKTPLVDPAKRPTIEQEEPEPAEACLSRR